MNLILRQIEKSENYKSLNANLTHYKGPINVSGCNETSKSIVAGIMDENSKSNLIYVASNEFEAKKRYDELKYLLNGRVYLMPAKDIFFYSSNARSKDIMKERVNILQKLVSNEKICLITSVECFLDKISTKEYFVSNVTKIKTNDTIDMNSLEKKLIYLGYEKCTEVNNTCEYSIRGGIVDIYPINTDTPVRIEFWGDDVESIRTFDIETQVSFEKINEITIYPAKDILFDEEKLENAKQKITKERKNDPKKEAVYDKIYDEFELKSVISYPEKYINFIFEEDELVSIGDYLSKEDIIVLDEIKKIEQKCNVEKELFYEYLKEEILKDNIVRSQMDIRFVYEEFLKSIEKFKIVLFSTFDTKSDIKVSETIYFNMKTIETFKRSITNLKDEVIRHTEQNEVVLVLSSTEVSLSNLKAEFLSSGFTIKVLDINADEKVKFDSEIIYLANGALHGGFCFEDIKFTVISEDNTFNTKNRKAVKRKEKGSAIESFTDLNIGDFIVHEDHGIGIYEGVQNITVLDVSKDYLKISYADNSTLYVSIENLDLVEKYIGNDDKPPKVNKLNGAEWRKSKAKVKESVKFLAEKLVKLYAERSQIVGFEFSPDNEYQSQFENEFEYIETNDQLLAIEDVKADMESSKVMDRLLCGDVGFGKTEVALRAAFKAVQDGKQVALLAPTTILVEQHYKTFKQRMKNYPIEIEYISRFRTERQIRETFENIRKGKTDIIVGTHKILNEALEFKDLGLIIVDEEQRFGVIQKEKLKNKNLTVDTLAMSATPIPRTLHMSLSGIRDISLIEEAPKERKPVQTFVIEHNEGLIKNAVYKEVGRGGQVFYLFNRVKGIAKLTSDLRKLMPDIRFEYAHGQMTKAELETVMREFVAGNIDVLVSTTIIETGIDIQNVNTMIIEDADRMGLSQLYQLKGRVGRSSRTAYAYLTYRKDKSLNEDASKRLQAIKEFTELGAGFKIAMRDMEIRGSGNLLGSEQHGHLASVGYDMYCKLLDEAVKELSGQEVKKKIEPKIELNVSAYMPSDYIEDSYTKIEVYKKIAVIETKDELESLYKELTDRFGEMSKFTRNLLNISLIKTYAKKLNINHIYEKNGKIHMTFERPSEIEDKYINSMIEFSKSYSQKISLNFSEDSRLSYVMSNREKESESVLVRNLIAFFETIIEGGEFEPEGESKSESKSKQTEIKSGYSGIKKTTGIKSGFKKRSYK